MDGCFDFKAEVADFLAGRRILAGRQNAICNVHPGRHQVLFPLSAWTSTSVRRGRRG